MSEVNWDKIESRSDTSAKSCTGCLGEDNPEVCRKLPRCTIGEGCHHVIWADKVPKGTPQEIIDGANTVLGIKKGVAS